MRQLYSLTIVVMVFFVCVAGLPLYALGVYTNDFKELERLVTRIFCNAAEKLQRVRIWKNTQF